MTTPTPDEAAVQAALATLVSDDAAAYAAMQARDTAAYNALQTKDNTDVAAAATAQSQYEAARTTLLATQDQLAAALAEIQALQHPTTSKTEFGAATQNFTGDATQAASYADMQSKIGPLAICRCYCTPNQQPSIPNMGQPATQKIALSIRATDSAAFEAGEMDAAITATAKAMAPGSVFIVQHEPDGVVGPPPGVGKWASFTITDLEKVLAHFIAVVKAANPQVIPALTLMDYSLTVASRNVGVTYANCAAMLKAAGGHIAWDTYNTTARDHGTYGTPAAQITGCITQSKAWGLPLAFAEVGVCLVPGDDGTGRAAYLTALGQAMIAAGAVWASYWNSDSQGGTISLHDAPSQAAWKALAAL